MTKSSAVQLGRWQYELEVQASGEPIRRRDLGPRLDQVSWDCKVTERIDCPEPLSVSLGPKVASLCSFLDSHQKFLGSNPVNPH